MASPVGEIAEMVPTVDIHTTNQQVDELFQKDKRCFGIVIVENDVPIGLVTRTNFYQKLGSLYGYNLYIGRSIALLMNKNILTVDYTASIIEVSQLAMKRKEEELYDYVILTKYGHYAGVVSISRLLLKFAEVQSQIASYLNPLTGLPGNKSIEKNLKSMLSKEKYSVLYIDLDHFKTYNDIYGFAKGDEMILATSSLLKKFVKKENGFLGHIGGDDFLIILYHHQYKEYCEVILKQFEDMLPSFYTKEHVKQKYVLAEDRDGRLREMPLVSLSIAVVTNLYETFLQVDDIVNRATKMKKLCKGILGNCYMDNSYLLHLEGEAK